MPFSVTIVFSEYTVRVERGERTGVSNDLDQVNEGRLSHHSTDVVLLGKCDVAQVTPVGGPRVLHQPIGSPVHVSVANQKHGVIQIIQTVFARRVIVDPVAVEGQARVAGVDADRQRTLVDQIIFDSVHVFAFHKSVVL